MSHNILGSSHTPNNLKNRDTNSSEEGCRTYCLSVRQWPWKPGFNPGRLILKTQNIVLDAALLNRQHYKVRIKGKLEQARERSCTLLYNLVL